MDRLDKPRIRFALLLCLLMLAADYVSAQSAVRHHPPTFVERGEIAILEFELQQAGDDQVTEALLFVRTSDRSSYSQHEERVVDNRVRFPLLVEDSVVSSVEYYLVLHLTDGREILYPDVQAGDTPIRVDIVEPEDDSLPSAKFINYTILSPKPGAVLEGDDILIALALFYNEEDLEGGTFLLKMNGRDITDEAKITPFMVNYRPDSLENGQKRLQVTFKQNNREYEVANWTFRVVENMGTATGMVFDSDRQQSFSGDMELGARNQQISGRNHDAITGRMRISGREGKLAWSARGYLTSQETSRMQPHNRYHIGLRYGDFLRIQAGDVYPSFNNLSVSGRRVRGLDAVMTLFNESLEVQIFLGRLNRNISSQYQSIRFEEDMVNGVVVDTLYTLQFREQGRGMFAQKITGSRLAIGDRERFQIAFHALKIEDDSTSLELIGDYSDILAHGYDLNGNLREGDIQNLEQNPDKLQISGGNPLPRGNFVAGTEFTLSLDNDRIRFFSEGGFSLINENITGGVLNRQRAEELGIVMDSDTESLFDRLSRLIIINEKMTSPPFRYIENDRGDLVVDTFFPTSVLAGDSRLNLNYFGQQLQVRYRWIGPDYHSLANSTVRRDITGINVTDRFRLLDNRLYITLGYENLRNNLTNKLDATLRTQTFRISFSWYPVNPDFPRLNLSGLYTHWNNNIRRFNPHVAEIDAGLVNAAVRNYIEEDGVLQPAPFPRLRSTYSLNFSAMQPFELFGHNHELNLNYGLIKTEDRYFAYGDYESQNISLRLTNRINRFGMPLRTGLGFSFNQSESTGGLSAVRIKGVDLRAQTFLMDGKLNVNMDLAFTGNHFTSLPLTVNDAGDPFESANDFYEPAPKENRTDLRTNAWIIRGGVEYEINNRHSIQGRMNFTNVYEPLGSRGLPNDHILQIRYIYRL